METSQALDQKRTALLRFSTAGSVDDGKSTLIGRLLFDSKSILEDQMEALERSADLTGNGSVNLANLTDGLRAEREQGITIDVAYRYFSTNNRKFIVADTPGHVQYTRNMVTGASTADAALILVDARQGVIEQTRRHAFISSLLRVPELVVCINKMDLVEFSSEIFLEIRNEFLAVSDKLKFRDITFIPVSALHGDNIVEKSGRAPWYHGPTLLEHLEKMEVSRNLSSEARFPVQHVIRPHHDRYHDFRGLAGRIASGSFRVGDEVKILPSGKNSKITQIHTYDGNLQEAHAPRSVTLLLEDDIDVGRGDLIVHSGKEARVAQEFEAMVCWMHENALKVGTKYRIKHLTKNTRCVVTAVENKVDVSDLSAISTDTLRLNDIGKVKIKTMAPLAFDSYDSNRSTGGFILIDEATNQTLGAGMITYEDAHA